MNLFPPRQRLTRWVDDKYLGRSCCLKTVRESLPVSFTSTTCHRFMPARPCVTATVLCSIPQRL
jgi:hypothetical protein